MSKLFYNHKVRKLCAFIVAFILTFIGLETAFYLYKSKVILKDGNAEEQLNQTNIMHDQDMFLEEMDKGVNY